MGLLSFIKDAGEKLFGGGTAHAAQADPTQANAAAGKAIEDYIGKLNLDVSNLQCAFDGGTGAVTVNGECADQATKEKVLLAAGNVAGVEKVQDSLTVKNGGAESRYYTVKSGDTLSKISKEMYGDANKYPQIFEANKPMLKDPNKIYPGQQLRIPPEA